MKKNYFLLILLFFTINQSKAQSSFIEKIKSHAKRYKEKRDSTIQNGGFLIDPFLGPGFSPENGFTIGGGVLATFKTDRLDSIIPRSTATALLNFSTSGSIGFAIASTTYWKKDKIRVFAVFAGKSMPDHYFGVGFKNGYHTPFPDSTNFKREWITATIRPIFRLGKTNAFIGPDLNFNYTKAIKVNHHMAQDSSYIIGGSKNHSLGLGLIFTYDSRDNPPNAKKGWYAMTRFTVYNKSLGSKNNYNLTAFDLRYYLSLFKKYRVFAFAYKFQYNFGEIPWSEMPSLGSDADLRGYRIGKYRDVCTNTFTLEYRHKFYWKNKATKHGMILFSSIGCMGKDVKSSLFTRVLPSVGIGYRFELQPGLNLRIDFGFGFESSATYFNFGESF
ncbi:BamA/TamA family outer membrane protein [Fluviicola taffensis]|uniref:BamA/TamA family outer membrane protein n=1 Tax=Fluviicola taffensis TaxID=191579 RepID=UPI00313798B8